MHEQRLKSMIVTFDKEYLRDLYETGKWMIANNIDPCKPTHPGDVLREEIEYRGISQKKLADQIGISYKVLNDIVNCRRPITTSTALLLEAALGIPAHILTGMQVNYNIQTAKQDKSFIERLAHIKKVAAML